MPGPRLSRYLLLLALVLAGRSSAEPTGDDVLTLSEALALAANSTFNPLVDCGLESFVPYNSSFLGDLQFLRTGDVLQAFYRFRRDDCGSDSEASDAKLDQPPLLLLPGLGSTVNDWGVPFLAAVSCGQEVVALDYRGAGHSIDYSTAPLTYYTMADGVVMLAEALNLTKPNVLGWSTGGNIALMLGALHGDRFGKLIGLGAMAGSNRTILPDIPDIFSPANLASLTPVQKIAIVLPIQDPDFVEAGCEFVKDVLSMPGGISVTVNETVYEGQYLADVDFTTMDPTIWDALPDIENRVLLVQGAQDVLVPAANAQLIADRIPNSWLVLYAQWGHAPKDIGAFQALVGAFLDFST